jgi:hypothetical protein
MGSDTRTERVFNLHDHARLPSGTVCVVWGYEWSDGNNTAGKPRIRYHGWFYHIREEGSGDESIVPEDTLKRVIE